MEQDATIGWWNGADRPTFIGALLDTQFPAPAQGPLRFAVDRDFWLVPGTEVVMTGQVLRALLKRMLRC
jgi:hypothetical protein